MLPLSEKVRVFDLIRRSITSHHHKKRKGEYSTIRYFDRKRGITHTVGAKADLQC